MAQPKPTLDEIRQTAEITPGTRPGEEMVTCRALVPMMDNGQKYAPGETLHMEIGLVPAHVAAGQVEFLAAEKTAGTTKSTKGTKG